MNQKPLCLTLICDDGDHAQDALETVLRQIKLKVCDLKARGREVKGDFSAMVCSSGVLENFVRYGTPMPKTFTQAKARLVVGLDEEAIQLIRQLQAQIKSMKVENTDSLFFLNVEQLVEEECQRRQITKIWLQGSVNSLIDDVAEKNLSEAGLVAKNSRARQIEIGAIVMAMALKFTEDVRLRDALVQEIRGKIAKMAESANFEAYVMDVDQRIFFKAAERTVPWGPEIIDLYDLVLKGVATHSLELAKKNFCAS